MKLTPIYFVHPVYMCENNQPAILNRFCVIAFQKRGTNFFQTPYIYKYKPLGGSSYTELPKEYSDKMKGLLNIRNKDNMCFKWCHIAHKFPAADHKQRVTKYT